MIATRLENPKGEKILMFVLEPGNIEKLKRGEPVYKILNEFLPGLSHKVELLLAYTPDVAWVSEQWEKYHASGGREPKKLAEFVVESLTRRPVVDRSQSAESMKRVDL